MSEYWRRARASKTAAFVAPFAVFLAFLPLVGVFRVENSELPWWRHSPEQWIYPVQTLLCLGLLIFWGRHYPFRPVRGLGFAVAIGLAGIAIWLAPVWCFEKFGLGGDESPLRWLGFRERRDGFDPTLLGHGPNPVGSWLVLGLRFLRLVVVVPLVEEIFWRGFLMRWLIESAKRWDELDVGAFAWKSFGLTTAFFALAHAGPDVAVALVYGALAGWVTVRTRGLTAVIVMHAVANFALGIFVMKTGWWGLW